MELLIYLLKVSACTAFFFAFYLLVLRRLTFFKINRFYLLGTLLLSFVIPSLHINVERPVAQTVAILPVNTDLSIPGPDFNRELITGAGPVLQEVEPFDWTTLIIPFYVGISILLFAITSWRILLLLKHTKKETVKINRMKLVSKTAGFTNCSFFNYVFIDESKLSENELQILLAHESVHVMQYHSLDKVLLMLAKVVLWLNPIVYLYDKALEETHEFEADARTSQSFGTADYADLLLRLAVIKSNLPLVHNFVKSPIKGRIKMLFNQKSNHMKKLVYVLALPILLGLVYGFTINYVDVFPSSQNENKVFTLVLDAGHGGNLKGVQVGKYLEKT